MPDYHNRLGLRRLGLSLDNRAGTVYPQLTAMWGEEDGQRQVKRGMASRGIWEAVEELTGYLREHIHTETPEEELEERTGQVVNHKRLRRLLNEHELGLPRQASKHSPSPVQEILGDAAGELNLVAGLDPGPLEAFSTDFTELSYAGGNRRAYLMAVVDLESKYVPGWAVGPSANRKLAMRCWEQVRERLTSLGEGLDGKIIHHDLDSVYTSYRWLRATLLGDEMRVSYSENGVELRNSKLRCCSLH
jgi:Integrase core domain.